MIELLIKFIQDRGYRVDVLPGILHIRKEAKKQIFGYGWAISTYDLHPDFEGFLYVEATQKLKQIDEAIVAYKEPA